MRLARTVLASAMSASILLWPAFAQQDNTGTITGINRLNGTIAIEKTQDATVGANVRSPSEEYKVQDGKMLDSVHAGDRVTFAMAGSDPKTITKLQKR